MANERVERIAGEMSHLLPTMMRHMFPYVFQPIHLPPSQVIALVSIQERGGCCLSELAREMHVSAPTVTGIIDRLERDKYVKRILDKKDHRVTNISLTAKGEALVKEFRSNIEKRWLYVLNKLPAGTQEGLIQVLRNITKGFTDGTI